MVTKSSQSGWPDSLLLFLGTGLSFGVVSSFHWNLRSIESLVNGGEGYGARAAHCPGCARVQTHLLALPWDGPREIQLHSKRAHLYKIRPCWLGLEQTPQQLQFSQESHSRLYLVFMSFSFLQIKVSCQTLEPSEMQFFIFTSFQKVNTLKTNKISFYCSWGLVNLED